MARSTRFLPGSSGRRSFLAQLGLWGSAFAGLSATAKTPARPREVPAPLNAEGRIGLLLPSAQACHGLDEHLVAGFQLALDRAREAGGAFRVEVVRASTSLSPSAYRKAGAKLLGEQEADLVIALAQPGAASALAPAFEEAGCCLLMVDGGANLVRSNELGSHVFYNTLGQWESTWALGRWAAGAYGGEGFMVASAFEGGHDSLRAFRLGVAAAGSGEKGFHVPGMPLREARNGLAPALAVDLIRRTAPAYVVVLLGRSEGLEFLKAFQQAGLLGAIPLVGSAFLAEEAAAAGLGEILAGFTTASAWSAGLPTPANRAFLADYRRRNGQEADAFAALGFDTGCLLLAALKDSGGHVRFVREALERAAWDGPGGKRAMDAASHIAQGEIHLSRLDLSFGSLRASVIQSEPGLGNRAAEVDGLQRSPRPALVNPYPIY